MSIRLQCPGCHKQLALPDEAAGKTGRCPVCNAVFQAQVSEEPPVHVSATRQPRRPSKVALSMPQTGLSENVTAGGLSKTQKLVFAGAGAGVLLIAGVVVLFIMMKPSAPAPVDNRQAMANLPSQALPA